MDFTAFFEKVIFSIGGGDIVLGQVILALLVFIASVVALLLLRRFFLFNFLKEHQQAAKYRNVIHKHLLLTISLLLLLALIYIWGENIYLYTDPDFTLSNILSFVLLLQLGYFADWLITNVIGRGFSIDVEKKAETFTLSRIVRPFIYAIGVWFFIRIFDFNPRVLFFNTTRGGFNIYISNIVGAVSIFFGARLVTWILINLVFDAYYKKRDVDIGSRYAFNQLFKYFIYTIAILGALESLGFNLTLIWGGAAALLVGIGLGLQQTFNDLICGFILLFERTIEIGNVVEIDDLVGTVKKIGLRTSIVETRDNISVIVPNSKLVAENIINWSHYRERARFKVNIGVAYGSDVDKVKEVLMEVLLSQEKIMSRPSPFVRFADFGDSSLNFELFFWSRELWRIENVKSDIRFKVYKAFQENNIEIPFPQRDVWVRSKEPE